MIKPTKNGYYGPYGGAFIPELLYSNVHDLQEKYERILDDQAFKKEYENLLKHYVGRPSPLYYTQNLSAKYNCQLYLKREDLNHTGAHKINNAIGQVLLAKKLGKHKIIAETGAGQHGVATATACALLGLPCVVFMGAKDIARQQPNVLRMKMLGAEVSAVTSGSATLKDATNEAIRYWINHPEETHYVIGSVVGPHPYPDLVTQFQSIISKEIIKQLQEQQNINAPNCVLACVGGGSNAAGAFYHFLEDNNVKLVAAEAAGEGVDSGLTAATIQLGKPGVFHGAMSYVMQDQDGQITEPHSISAGLDYPGVGPLHSHLNDTGRVTYLPITDAEAIHAAFELVQLEGIIPAIESAHALALLPKLIFKPNDVVVICLSGRGDKDLGTYQQYFKNETV